MTKMKEAMFYDKDCNLSVNCTLCPVACKIAHGQSGFCKVRHNIDGTLYAKHYGKITSIALDPVEKKPLNMFYKGSKILSVGGYGCNFRCPFCQNHEISMGRPNEEHLSCNKALEIAIELKSEGNIGIAYTYNEPFINYEFMLDTSKIFHENGLKNVIVTNGYVNKAPLRYILPYIDAMNIDLKGYSDSFYRMVGGKLEKVKDVIEEAVKSCHVELTTLVIPGENDNPSEIEKMAEWVASIDPEIPLHLTRFFPRFKMTEKEPTPLDTISELADISKKYLKNVFY